jgi:membrane protein implicated in regulation of membrane protease activity
MYCPSCGLQQTQELRYCPRCGANLNPSAERVEPPNLVGPIWAVSLAVTLITLLGLGLAFAFILVIISKGIAIGGSLMLITAFFLFVVLIIAGLLVRQLSRLLNLYQKPDKRPDKNERPDKNQLAGREAPQLEAMRESPLGITENTTRTFEPAPADRQTKQNAP